MFTKRQPIAPGNFWMPSVIEGDAMLAEGLGGVTSDATFPYPEAVNMRRIASMGAVPVSMIPFRLGNSSKTISVPKNRRY